MKRYEYKTVKVPGGSLLGGLGVGSDALVELLNREGREGRHPATVPPNVVAWRTVILEREKG